MRSYIYVRISPVAHCVPRDLPRTYARRILHCSAANGLPGPVPASAGQRPSTLLSRDRRHTCKRMPRSSNVPGTARHSAPPRQDPPEFGISNDLDNVFVTIMRGMMRGGSMLGRTSQLSYVDPFVSMRFIREDEAPIKVDSSLDIEYIQHV